MSAMQGRTIYTIAPNSQFSMPQGNPAKMNCRIHVTRYSHNRH